MKRQVMSSLERQRENMLRERDLNITNALDIPRRIKENIIDAKFACTVQSKNFSQTVPAGHTQKRRIIILFLQIIILFFLK